MSKQEWGRIAFGDICSSLVNGGTPNTGVTHYWNGQIPWITGADFLKQSIAQIRRHITPVAPA